MPTLEQALTLALGWLRQEAAAGWPGAMHRMRFPHAAGFGAGAEEQASDQFARNMLALVLADLADALRGHPAELGPDADPAVWAALAAAEADRLAEARLTDRRGGWSYFPGLPELPPDLDSLAAAMQLFGRVAPQHLALTDAPVALALRSARADGACPTWLIAGDDEARARQRMLDAVRLWWGDAIDVDVNVRFALALAAAGRDADAARVVAFVRRAQGADGLWPVSWYWNPIETALMACRLPGVDAGAARAAVADCRRVVAGDDDEGGWGSDDSVALDTALAVVMLAGHDREAVAAGVHWLLGNQSQRGSWRASPWIRMDVGRSGEGGAVYSARHGCQPLSTAWATLALLRARACL